ncbi:serine/threonine-protein kinase [Pseudofrankia inefficax]|uniref:serine/threonine-protein kinase n=1 Tax=Pseudofrankia inefficax (strain DSM 45817 / CECT 9037 / DDB 130130 / EuI1c) TaxID=298654 RepID=UPI0018DF5C50|nr:serine/threonine-protein kinase [Pseudofrankia inefficax]
MTHDLGRMLAGRYRLTGMLGQGGMGAVWRAHDEQLGRDVAVKELRLPEQLTAAERTNWIARLDREARAAARLKHPGIVTIHDRVTGEDGRPWIVMELVHGGSLGDLLKSTGPLPPEQVAGIGLQVLAALSAAHQAGITHRDIKPANILLEDDRVVLTDFGIAALDGDATLTASGMLLGTPAFMAPEQVNGLPATAESDLWSLGATLYTAVEGRPPFSGTNPGAVLVSVATQDPAPALRAGPLGAALSGLLRKEPARRPTADQLREILLPLAGGRRGAATQPAPPRVTGEPPVGPPTALRPPAATRSPRLTPGLRTAIIAAVLVLAAGAATVGYVLHKNGHSDATADAYRANLRVAQAMKAPPGFSRRSVTRLTEGKARVTYAASSRCVAECGTQLRPVLEWLREFPGVAAVYPPKTGENIAICHKSGDCLIAVTPYRKPAIVGGDWYGQDGELFVQIDVG